MKLGAVIVGGGSGSRLGADLPKAFIPLGGTPLYQYSLKTFVKHPKIEEIIFVFPQTHSFSPSEKKKWGEEGVEFVVGGKTRQQSVFNGLAALSGSIQGVLVHDAARPFLTTAVIDRLIASLEKGFGGIAALPVTDTVKQADGECVVSTIDRSQLWIAQTPQAFPVTLLKQAYARAEAENWVVTDEASLIERLGERVALISGDSRNFKITTADDLALAEIILKGL